MFLGADNDRRTSERIEQIRAMASLEPGLSRWFEHPVSEITHHEDDCCEEARMWFLSYARAMEIGSLSQFNIRAPTWLSKHFKWGPTEWPIAWCEIVKEETIDCGAFAALAREIFTAQGHQAHSAQALLSYSETCTKHWKDLWEDTMEKHEKKVGERFPWIGDRLVYHELCMIEMANGEAKFYDSTHGTWYEPHQRLGFGALLALKSDCPRSLRWGEKTIYCGEWFSL